jgi:pilus assembly protein CpaC
VHTLAKPTLVAVSGGKASFLAGGEFPYPVPQQAAVGSNVSNITIDFREYGVKLKFQPFVQDNGLIRLAVNPEVSQLDQANAIKIGGVQIPGLITRKADTTVEIRDGDSLAIGGLFQHTYTNDLRQFPVLGSLPVIGSLFRSARWNKGETELVIIVTPHVVTASDFDRAKRTAAASIGEKEPKAFDFVVNGEAFKGQLNRDLAAPPGPPGPVAAAQPPAATALARAAAPPVVVAAAAPAKAQPAAPTAAQPRKLAKAVIPPGAPTPKPAPGDDSPAALANPKPQLRGEILPQAASTGK